MATDTKASENWAPTLELPDSRNNLVSGVVERFKSLKNAAVKYASSFAADQAVDASNSLRSFSRDLVDTRGGEIDLIDVVSDYDWTFSQNKVAVGDQIPFIRLTEFKIAASNVANSLQSALMAYSDIAAANNKSLGAAEPVISKALGIANAVTGSLAPNSTQSVDDIFANLKDNVDGKISSFFKPITDTASRVVNAVSTYAATLQKDQGFGSGSGNLTDLFGGIYTRKPTGREYTLPYFTDNFISINNDFQDSYEGLAGAIGKGIESFIEGATTLPSIVEPGVYVQRPKFYNFKSSGPTVEVTFNLFNTMTSMAHLRNTELIQKLVLNNLPRRFSRVVIEPPCIYEVLIPGKAFYPYCFIKNLQVKHAGTKRVIGGEIIPDAYQVTITLESLTTDASNFYDPQMTRHGMTFTSANNEAAPATNATTVPAMPTERPQAGNTQIEREALIPSNPPPAPVVTPVGQISQSSAAAASVPSAPVSPAQIENRGYTSYRIPGMPGF